MIDRLNTLLLKETGDELLPAKIAVHPVEAKTAEAVWEEVRKFHFDSGWLCLTDEVLPLRSAADLEKAEGRTILSGELAQGSESLHIRQGENGWNIIRLKLGAGDPCLMLRESFISTEEKQQLRLDYEVFWKRSGEAYEPYAFRFTGFSNAEEGA